MTGESRAGATSIFADDWLTARNFSIALAVLIFAMFPQVITGQETFFFRDFPIFGYSWASYHRAAIWEGTIPLWNPLSNCGIPFLAQWNTMTLYPLSVIYLLLPMSWSVAFFCLFHMWLAGVGMFLLARRWTDSRWPAAFAGIAYTFSGLLLNSLTWPNNIAALAWLPWMLFLGEDLRAGMTRRSLLAPIVGATQMLSGAPEVILLSWILLAVVWLPAWVTEKEARTKVFLRFIFFGGSVTALCAAQLLPFLDLLAHSHRDANYAVGDWPMPWWGVGNFFLPLLFTFPYTGAGVYFQYDQYWTTSYYVGIATAALAVMALPKARGRWLALAILLVVALVLAMGEKFLIYAWLRKVIPIFGVMRYPIKIIVLAEFIVPLLAAFALARLAQSDQRRFLLNVAIVGGIALIACLYLGRFHPIYPGKPEFNRWTETWQNGVLRALMLILFLGILRMLFTVDRAQTRALLSGMVLFILWLDLRTHVPNQNPSFDRAFYDSVEKERNWPAKLAAGARAMPSPFAEATLHNTSLPKAEEDFMRKRLGLYCNLNLIENVAKVNGVFSLQLRDEAKFETALYKQPTTPLLDFLSVQYFTKPNSTIEWNTRTNFLPLITSGQKPVFVSDVESLDLLLRNDFNPRQVVFLPPEEKLLLSAINGAVAQISNQKLAGNKIEFQTEAAEPALVVLSQAYYHWWRPYVDGQPARLMRANYAFQAFEVPAGRHDVRLHYEDRYFQMGAAISGTALLGLLFMALRVNSSRAG